MVSDNEKRLASGGLKLLKSILSSKVLPATKILGYL
jgi:hypothetical protein